MAMMSILIIMIIIISMAMKYNNNDNDNTWEQVTQYSRCHAPATAAQHLPPRVLLQTAAGEAQQSLALWLISLPSTSVSYSYHRLFTNVNRQSDEIIPIDPAQRNTWAGLGSLTCLPDTKTAIMHPLISIFRCLMMCTLFLMLSSAFKCKHMQIRPSWQLLHNEM